MKNYKDAPNMMNIAQTKIKKPPILTQDMIDSIQPPPVKESRWSRIKRYLGETSGPVLTVAVLIAFVLGMWALFGIWKLSPVVKG